MLITDPRRKIAAVAAVLLLLLATGCTRNRNLIPADCVRPNVMQRPRGSREPVNFARLRQDPPAVYLLGPRDVLGIFIEGVLGRAEDPPPVHFSVDSDIPPAIGYPMPIREDGTVSLPLVPPIPVGGLTLAQAEYEIRKAYTIDRKILPPERGRIIVTLIKPRSYRVLVIREDTMNAAYGWQRAGTGAGFEPERRSYTRPVDLRAYENDLLHALAETGGLPGIDAKGEVTILKGAFKDENLQSQYERAMEDPLTRAQMFAKSPNAIRIPLRVGPGDAAVTIRPEDVILQTGDIVFIESRDSEVFYTGGLLRGGQFPIPRDYDLDVLGAIAMSGGSIAAAAGSSSLTGGISRGGVGSIFPPTRVVVLRTINGQQVSIKVNLKTAMTNPQERLLIQPNDFIMLEYSEFELFMNVLLNNVNLNLSINELFRD